MWSARGERTSGRKEKEVKRVGRMGNGWWETKAVGIFPRVSLVSSLTPEAPDNGSKQQHRESFGRRIKDLAASLAARNRSRWKHYKFSAYFFPSITSVLENLFWGWVRSSGVVHSPPFLKSCSKEWVGILFRSLGLLCHQMVMQQN